MKHGMLAEFAGPEALLQALVELRRLGYREIDAFTPYPLKEAEPLLGLGRSAVGWLVFPLALAAAGTAYVVQWALNGYDYPLDVGGRPLHSAPAFIPITFELGVLGAAISAFLLLLAYIGLPELYSPVFTVEGFESASSDRFWVGVDVRDPAFDRARLGALFRALGASRVSLTGAAP